jgi:hypothetical protein
MTTRGFLSDGDGAEEEEEEEDEGEKEATDEPPAKW